MKKSLENFVKTNGSSEYVQELYRRMTEAETHVKTLRSALVGLVGAETEEQLGQMEVLIRAAIAPDSDKAVTINAIDALRDTNPQEKSQ